jgi:hypothetical protein
MTTPESNPAIPGKEPTFRHMDDDDMGWRNVKAQRNADGSQADWLVDVRTHWAGGSIEHTADD